MTLAELAQTVLLALAGSVPAWRDVAVAGLALLVVGLVLLAHELWSQL